jgi:cell surface hyaluronidase
MFPSLNMRATHCPVGPLGGSSIHGSRRRWRGLVSAFQTRWTRISLGWIAFSALPAAGVAAPLPSPASTNPPAATITANARLTASLLPNGGAESTTGWTFVNSAALAVNGSPYVVDNPAAPQGTTVLRIQNLGNATLAVNIPAAGSYRLRMLVAQRKQGTTNNAQVLEVTIGGNIQVDQFQPASSNYTEQVTRTFTAAAGATTIKFSGLNLNGGDNTALVDRIQLEQVREWGDATSWTPARVPLATDNVSIPVGRTIAMKGTCAAATVNVAGQLLSTTANATLSSRWVLVRGLGAVFEVGRKDSPYRQKFVLTLTGNLGATENILDAGTKFLMAEMEGLIYLHGDNSPLRRSWTQLGATALAGDTVLTLKENVNWKAGDEIVIAASAMWTGVEKRTLASDAVGNQVTLTDPLTYRHLGVTQTRSRSTPAKTWTLDQRAEVGLLTRNIRIEGDAASETNGFGGHIMVMWCAACGSSGEAYIDGVELYRMGQKQRLGRYPMHWHMLGAEGIDQYFNNSSVHHSFNRAVTIHGTWSTLVDNNVMYDHIGHGLFLENGSEIDNVVSNNLVLSTLAPAAGEEVTPSDNEFSQIQNASPSSYWITNPRNTFINNVAAGTDGTGFWFIFPTTPLAPSGTDSRFSSMEPYKMRLTEFRGNRAHSCRNGFDVNDRLTQAHGIDDNGPWDIPASNPAIIQDFSAYSMRNSALYAGVGNASANVIYDNAVLADSRDHVFFATFHIVRNSLLLADSGNGLQYFPNFPDMRSAFRTYDGAGQLEDCHLVGFDQPNTTVIGTFGGSTKHVNNRFRGVTFAGAPRIELPDANANSAENQFTRWASVILDETGSLTGLGLPNYSVVSNHVLLRTPGDGTKPSWVNAFYTPARFNLLQLAYNLTDVTKPAVTVVRKRAGQADVTWFNNHTDRAIHQTPVIVNDGYTYEIDYAGQLPSTKRIQVIHEDAAVGDDFIVRIKAVGLQPGFTASANLGTMKTSLANLTASTTTGYYRNPTTGDVSIKFVATATTASALLTWN